MTQLQLLREKSRWLFTRAVWLSLLVLAWLSNPALAAVPAPPGGPILVVTSPSTPYGPFHAEILRAEGLNEFAVANVAALTAPLLSSYDVVLLGKTTLTAAQVTLLSNWVNAGGNLIAIAPDAQLAPLLGLTPSGSTLANAYLRIDTAGAPGNGLTSQTIQFHGTADRYTTSGATTLATLYSDASTVTANPAVTLRSVGSGKAAAFTYDLAASIVLTRQGNPAWANQERDGFLPQRSDDKFFGNSSSDPQADWIDLSKVAIPQADEQQRLLANLILHVNQSKKPLPRFWYFPRGEKAVVVMTGDDHGNGGTIGRFDQFKSRSPANCSVADWECVRGTSYIYTSTPLTNAQAVDYTASGFEVGVHINTGCSDFTAASLTNDYDNQIAEWQTKYSGIPAPITQRHHCIAWSDWATGAVVQAAHGIRLDTSYYFWPPGWVGNVPGLFTGSAMPMRFSALDGTLIDVFQATSQMTDESGQTYPFTIDTLLDRALGADEVYGVYTVNAHTDVPTIPESDTVVTSALARSVPVVSSKQMLNWLDGRDGSSFGSLAWNGTQLSFTVTAAPGSNGLQGMLPTRFNAAALTGLTRGGNAVSYTVKGAKGVEYAFFNADAGTYVATYAGDTGGPSVASTTPAAGSTAVPVETLVTATFSEAMNPATLNTSTFELRNSLNVLVPATVSYSVVTRTATLRPSNLLAPSATYTATVRGGTTDPSIRDAAGNPAASSLSWSFTTVAGQTGGNCPCTSWGDSVVPANPSVNDPNPVELGVKFRSDVNGFVTGVRFYKGSGNTGTHVGNLWTSGGQLLATATFTNESATGWQQVTFASPVAVTANTVYVASYHAPNGGYAGDGAYFTNTGVDRPPIHLLQDGVSGGNGVYGYGASGTFPAQSYNATNYWVDVVFNTDTAPDTTPPTVSSTTPVGGATGINVAATVSAVFNEPMNAASLTTASFELRDASNTLIAGSVSYNAGTRTVTLTPGSPLAASAVYTATVRGGGTDPRAKDAAGNALAGNFSWSFTTAAGQTGYNCPCTGWPASAVPTVAAANDSAGVELGVKFRADVNGFITGVRFYKSSTNTGTHVGNLWTTSGQLLSSATFTGESASGWQQVNFVTPVAVTADTVYVASYHAPNGRYAADANFFASTGVDRPPIHLLRNGVNGGNGVYVYTSSSSFPSQTYNSSNYWVDVVFTVDTTPDTTPPTVSSTTPAGGATGVNVTAPVSALFNEAMDPASLTTASFELRDGSNNLVAGGVSYNVSTRTASFTPASTLTGASTYTATVRGGPSEPRARDLAGNALGGNFTWSFTTGVPGGPCASPANSIVAENCLTGSPSSEWDVGGAGDPSIQGFATQISVNRGSTVSFKVDTDAAGYRFDIYRMGYYGGSGARKVATVLPTAALPQNQPNCLNDSATGLVDCGNWAVSGSWAVPANATSGIYFARPVRNDNQGASHIFFVVRNDASNSDLLFQTSDTTWQAYNQWGGNSLYSGAPVGRAYKVSYNRPFNTRIVDGGQDWIFNAEYPMVRWLESNGYDVSYLSGVDSDRSANLLLNHKAFLSVGHDEYWSGAQRANVEAARNAGVNLAFLSGNEVFWKTRWENSIDGSGTSHRTLVCYKETHANAKIDPTAAWTGTWRDPRFSPPADGGRPENALTGTSFLVNGATSSIRVPAADGKMRLWRNTSIANLAAGDTATLPDGTLGYEWDTEPDNGFRPAGLFRMATTTVPNMPILLDQGSTYGTGPATHALTMYRHSSGARVFGAGTIQWSWGLDEEHDRGGTPSDVRMQQATVNLLADMGAQPGTLQSGLVPATASTDTTPPASSISSPAANATLPVNTPVTISGTATDAAGGVVGGVEVSVNGGSTWRPATGRGTWTFSWTPTANGTVTLRSRAVDDSGNIETPSAGVTVNVGTGGGGGDTTPPTVSSSTPSNGATNQSASVTATAVFNEAMTASTINSGTFELSGAGGVLVASTVAYDTAARRATLTPSQRLVGGVTYTATVRGGATDPRVKDSAGNALAANRVWTFTVESTRPTVTSISPSSGATFVSRSANITATFSEAMDPASIGTTTFEVRNASTNALVPAVVTYDSGNRRATLNPNANLASYTLYNVTVRGGSTDPRVKDLASNALASNRTWSFRTTF